MGMTISIPLVLPSVPWAHFSTLYFLGEVESLLIVDPILHDTLVLALTCDFFGELGLFVGLICIGTL